MKKRCLKLTHYCQILKNPKAECSSKFYEVLFELEGVWIAENGAKLFYNIKPSNHQKGV